MSVILKEIDIPKSCGGCNARDTCVCQKWVLMDRHIIWSKRHEDCPLKSVEGLVKFIKEHSYPVRYDRNSIEQGMTITGIEQAIKDYCGMEVKIDD